VRTLSQLLLLLFELKAEAEIIVVLGAVLMTVNVSKSSSLKAEVILEKRRGNSLCFTDRAETEAKSMK